MVNWFIVCCSLIEEFKSLGVKCKMTKPNSKNAKSAYLRVIVLLILAVIVCVAAMYLVQKNLQRPSLQNIDPNSVIQSPRKETWAQRIELEGVENFHKVSDELYRGAQPSDEGMRELEKLGTKTIVNLRSFHSDRGEIKGTDLTYEHIYMKAWHAEDKEVVRFLKIVSDKEHTPVFVHCMHGADRTGTMCAIYRIAIQGWSKAEAVEEMTKGGFGFHSVWENLPEYLEELDIEEMKRQAGLEN